VKLLHASLDVWHRTRLNVDRFGAEWEPFRLTVQVYEELDPGCCVVAMDDSGALIGSAFFHPRETHVGVGVVTVHPAAFGRGVGRALMEEIIRAADDATTHDAQCSFVRLCWRECSDEDGDNG
jgi:GNAT superfamily N-acetyltransferase